MHPDLNILNNQTVDTPENSGTHRSRKQGVTARRMSVLDATFLRIETRETPAHIAGLMILQQPEDAAPDFVRQIVATYRADLPLHAPWSLKLAKVPLSWLVPAMVPTDDVDLDYHVQHMSLPSPGGERELGEFISYLHGQPLDRSRPLWTCHVIEGLSNRRFAIYIKMHHALTDGVNAIRLFARSLATTPGGTWHAPWHTPRPVRSRAVTPLAATTARPPQRIADALFKALKPVLRPSQTANPVMLPFQAPRSVLNSHITAARRVATQRLELKRIQHLAKHTDTSVNDIFLAICGSALRRHLQSSGDLTSASLVAGVPVNLRETGEEDGNAIGFFWTTLATQLDDPMARLKAIHDAMAFSKAHMQAMTPPVQRIYNKLTLIPTIGVMLSGLGARLPPPMNIVISNVPGPDGTLYMGGARLEAIYPVSLPLQGMGLNISCISYDGHLDIGITGSRDGLPSLQKIAVYLGEALDELESCCRVNAPSEALAAR